MRLVAKFKECHGVEVWRLAEGLNWVNSEGSFVRATEWSAMTGKPPTTTARSEIVDQTTEEVVHSVETKFLVDGSQYDRMPMSMHRKVDLDRFFVRLLRAWSQRPQ